jgi:hypothetical protein
VQHAIGQRACCRRSVRGNKLTRLAAPATNGTCCATTINVGPTEGSDQPIQLFADGSYNNYNYKNVPIDHITVCATDAANPGKRQNNEGRDEEKGYTFKLSVRPTCDDVKSDMSLRVQQEQARPHTRARARRLPARGFGPVVAPMYIALKCPAVPGEYPVYRRVPGSGAREYLHVARPQRGTGGAQRAVCAAG